MEVQILSFGQKPFILAVKLVRFQMGALLLTDNKIPKKGEEHGARKQRKTKQL